MGTPIVNFTDVFHKRGLLVSDLQGKVTLEQKEIDNFLVKKGDIFFTRTSETVEEIGYPSVMLESPENTVFSGFVLRGRTFLEQDPLEDVFKKYVFFTDSFRKEMMSKSSMTTRALTSGTAIKNMVFYHPLSKEEQKKIGDYFSKLDNLITLQQRKFVSVFEGLQNNTLSRADLNYENGTVKNVHYGDVLIKFGDYIDASRTDLPYISDDAKADKFKNSFLQDGDIIIADTAEDDTVGKCTEIQGSEGLKLLSGLHTVACRPKEKYGPMFLGYYINSPAYHNQLKPLMQGIKVTSISKSALQDTDMIMPKSIEEQTMIGGYFANLDSLITLQQCKS